MKTISNKIIRQFSPCYDPSKIVSDENEELTVVEWVNKYRKLVDSEADIIWLLCRKKFMSDRDMRLFAVWCARESFKLQESVDERSVNAVNMAEKFATGECTENDLSAARAAAWSAVWSAESAALSAAGSAAWSAESAAESAARLAVLSAEESVLSAAQSAQINQLLTYFV